MYALTQLGDLGRRASGGTPLQKLQARIAAIQKQLSEDTARLAHVSGNRKQRLQAKIDQLNIKLADLQTQLANLQAGIPPPVTSTTTTPLDVALPYTGDTQTIQPVTPSTSWMTSGATATTSGGGDASAAPAQNFLGPPTPAPALSLSNPWILGGAAVVLFLAMRKRSV